MLYVFCFTFIKYILIITLYNNTIKLPKKVIIFIVKKSQTLKKDKMITTIQKDILMISITIQNY